MLASCGTRGKQKRGRTVRLHPRSPAGAELADRVKSILETRNLSLYSVSQKSESMFGHASPYSLPHNLYYELKLGTFSPSLHQLFALSRISDYRLAEWLRVFGLDLEDIPRLEILLPTKRTILLDASLSNPNAWITWFRNKVSAGAMPQVAPLSQLLEAAPAMRQSSLLELNKENFLYAKIGREDALAFPDLLPGSIVRINPRLAGSLSGSDRIFSDRIFLVEHSKGFCCCRLLPRGKDEILLVSTHHPYAQVQLQLHREVRILGVADLEIRPLNRAPYPRVPLELANRWKPDQLARGTPRLSQFLRAARAKVALSLRDASALSRRIARLLNDERFFISASSLSDYEARDTVPRHFQKVVSLCLVYSISFRTFLEVAGLGDQSAGRHSIPDRFIPGLRPPDIRASLEGVPDDSGFLGELLRRCREIPFFLKGAVADVSGLSSPSLPNFFWLGGIASPLHPYLANALLVSVDRHVKRPVDSRSRPVWEQSFYVLLKRDGTYLCCPCGVENGTLVMHPDPAHLNLRQEFRNRRDAEVVGRVCTVVREL